MFPVLPLDIPVPNLLKGIGLEARCKSQFTEPRVYTQVDTIRCRIPDNETSEASGPTKRTQRLEHKAEVAEVRCCHSVIVLLPPFVSRTSAKVRQAVETSRLIGSRMASARTSSSTSLSAAACWEHDRMRYLRIVS